MNTLRLESEGVDRYVVPPMPGVGIDLATKGFFLFTELASATSSAQASNSVLVALEAVTFASGSTQPQQLEVRMVFHDGQENVALTVPIWFMLQDDWRSAVASESPGIPSGYLGGISSRISTVLTGAFLASEMDAAHKGIYNYSMGLPWADMGLALASIAYYRSTINTDPSGEGGGQTTISASGSIAFSVDTESFSMTHLPVEPESNQSSDSIIVILDAANFQSEVSETPKSLNIRVLQQNGQVIAQPVFGTFSSPNWRTLLASESLTFSEQDLQAIIHTAESGLATKWFSSPQAAVSLASSQSGAFDARIEAGVALAAAARGLVLGPMSAGHSEGEFSQQDLIIMPAASNSSEPGEVIVPTKIGLAIPGEPGEYLPIDSEHLGYGKVAGTFTLKSIVFEQGFAKALKVLVLSPFGAQVARIAIPPAYQRLDWSRYTSGEPVVFSNDLLGQVSNQVATKANSFSGQSVQSLVGISSTTGALFRSMSNCGSGYLAHTTTVIRDWSYFLIAIGVAGLAGLLAGHLILGASFSEGLGLVLFWVAVAIIVAIAAVSAYETWSHGDCDFSNLVSTICVSVKTGESSGFQTCSMNSPSYIWPSNTESPYTFTNSAHDVILFQSRDGSAYGHLVNSFNWMDVPMSTYAILP